MKKILKYSIWALAGIAQIFSVFYVDYAAELFATVYIILVAAFIKPEEPEEENILNAPRKELVDKMYAKYKQIPKHLFGKRDNLIFGLPEQEYSTYLSIVDGEMRFDNYLQPTFLGIKVLLIIENEMKIYSNGIEIKTEK